MGMVQIRFDIRKFVQQYSHELVFIEFQPDVDEAMLIFRSACLLDPKMKKMTDK